jgi:hypothetical protein
VHGLGVELQRRGVSRQRQWGARGIVSVHYISYPVCLTFNFHRASLFSELNAQPLNFNKRNTVTVDVGVQTHSVMVGINGHKTMHDDAGGDIADEEAATSLPASALASVLKWSKDIAADIHLFSGKHNNLLPFVTDYAN